MANNALALLAKVPDFETPVEGQAKVANLQSLLQGNQEGALKLQAMQRSNDQEVALNDLYRSALKPDGSVDRNAVYTGAAERGIGSIIPKLQKSYLDMDKSAADVQKTTADAAKSKYEALNLALGQHRDALNTINDPESAAKWVLQAYSDPVLGQVAKLAGSPEEAIARIPKDPASFQQWKMQASLNTDKLVKQTMPDANARLSAQTQLAVNGMNQDGSPGADVETMAKGIAAGKIAPISGFALAKPRGQAIMARVMEINPSYDAGDYAAKNNALKAFSTGKEGALLRSFNVASDHLDTLGQMADALNNKDTQVFNKVTNAWKSQTGSDAPTNFDAVKEIVSKEVVKAIVAGGGGVGEREELSKLMDKANSPAQLKGVITHFKELMDAQRSGLIDQYKRTTGRDDGETAFLPSKPSTTKASGIEGATSTSKSGKPIVFRNGNWEYQ